MPGLFKRLKEKWGIESNFLGYNDYSGFGSLRIPVLKGL